MIYGRGDRLTLYFALKNHANYKSLYMKAATGKLFLQLLGCVWLGALGIALVGSALNTDRQARQVAEYPCCCDPFGYLQMAQDIRQATAESRCPQFTIDSSHSRLLIELMKSRAVPLPLWDNMVGPLGYRYFPRADQLGVWYPPGAGLILALFPQDQALHSLDRLVIVVFVVGGLFILVFAAVKRAWLAAGMFILALELGLEVLGKIDNSSFSINAMLAPLLLSALCLFAAFGARTAAGKFFYGGWVLALLAGLFFGFAILVRLPVIFLMPGILVLLWPVNLRNLHLSAVLPFILGVLVSAVLPLSIHQSRLAGAWYVPTYPHDDTAPPALKNFLLNFSNYFGTGRARMPTLMLLLIIIGCTGLFFWLSTSARSDAATKFLITPNWKRLIAAASIMWGVPAIYFLTHQNAQSYYLAPSSLGTALLLALGAFGIEVSSRVDSRERGRSPVRGLRLVALALALSPGLIAMQRAWSNYERPVLERKPPRFAMPAELADERAWIWADDMSGTLWYYARKPAHKINSTDKATRALIYEFVIKRGEPQYVVGDDPPMKPVQDEIAQLGGTLELRGEVDGRSYYLIRWPAKGPAITSGN